MTKRPRRPVISISIRLILIASSSSLFIPRCHAQTGAPELISIFKSTCTEATTPEAMISAGEKAASAGKWKLIASGPGAIPMMHLDRGPKISYEIRWDLNLPQATGAALAMSIVRPPVGDIKKYSVCGIHPIVGIGKDTLESEIEQLFGSALTKDLTNRDRDMSVWFFASDKAVGNCGRRIASAMDRTSKTEPQRILYFSDVEFSKTSPASEMSRCPL